MYIAMKKWNWKYLLFFENQLPFNAPLKSIGGIMETF